jgi:glycine/D-amino acid oxidase-like deaminating enzyme
MTAFYGRAMTSPDYVVIGQGLAGTAVAWHLRWKRCRVLVIDRGDEATASRVAAGLVTPITGLRLVKTWRLDECFPAAVAFYRRVEAETGEQFFTVRNAVRLFATDQERNQFERRTDPAYRALVHHPSPPVNEEWFAAPHGGFEMSSAARLDVPRYLDASRDRFRADGSYLAADIDPARDVEPEAGGVRISKLGVRAKGVVFCQGLAGRGNPWFPGVRFTPAKGEVLTLRIPGLAEERVVYRGVWLVPVGGGVFRAGATYDRDDLTPTPTDRGRAEIVARLREFVRLPFEVIGHAAGVRPVVDGGRPVIGIHPDHPQLAVFNGLGSKGALLAPLLAAELAGRLAAESGNTVHSPPPPW